MDGLLTAEISASAVRANLALLRKLIAPAARLCAVVKSDFYGLGRASLLPTVAGGADCLAVATPGEAAELREAGYDGPVLLLLPAGRDRDTIEAMAGGRVAFTVDAEGDLPPLAAAGGRVGVRPEVHLHVNCGMCRGGASPGESATLAAEVVRRGLRLAGIYTHFSSADEGDLSATREQLATFRSVVAAIAAGEGVVVHAANSAATISLAESHLDMIRPGLAVYGYQPGDDMAARLPLRPAMRLVGRLVSVNDVPAGASCGYGLTHTFARDGRVGIVPIGYADGYLRALSNKATMRVCGRDVPVVGRVSMDQTIVDLTGVPQAVVGDAVEIISDEPAAANSLENLARLAGTIPYELLVRLGRRVRRVVADGTYQPEAPARVADAEGAARSAS
jgi:alanine racemase